VCPSGKSRNILAKEERRAFRGSAHIRKEIKEMRSLVGGVEAEGLLGQNFCFYLGPHMTFSRFARRVYFTPHAYPLISEITSNPVRNFWKVLYPPFSFIHTLLMVRLVLSKQANVDQYLCSLSQLPLSNPSRLWSHSLIVF